MKTILFILFLFTFSATSVTEAGFFTRIRVKSIQSVVRIKTTSICSRGGCW